MKKSFLFDFLHGLFRLIARILRSFIKIERESKNLYLWSTLTFIICQIFTFLLVFLQSRERSFLGVPGAAPTNQLSWWLILLYFFGGTLVMGLICWLIPIDKLKLALKITFTLLYVWAISLIFGIFLPFPWPIIIAIFCGAIWVLAPTIWLCNLFMVCALVSVGVIFGPLMSPWATAVLLGAVAIYDILACRFGFMQWLVKTLAECETLPVIIFPRKKISDLNLSFKKSNLDKILKDDSVRERFSLLGGGDIAFPLIFIVSVFYAFGFLSSLIVAFFSLIGLVATYSLYLIFIKGKAMPAMPPIVFFTLIGFLIVYFVL